ncbi:hypothetical protein [Lysinibacillus sp. BPa_S21]|uniref:hypothetical protein n=1 Tax=Lysinibacillus sp. BPa_S21 TaxID=2932478 RepID=UPI0020138E49|nr:hypothetical protein [Lysinibacillus sp. BPa_S21]MCL1697332.1 hypothetical protein [Lysinibacillus sp. BPa_S21]
MIDLFRGVGTFLLPFPARVKELAGSEIDETSIESVKCNAIDNDLHNMAFLAHDAPRGLDEMQDHNVSGYSVGRHITLRGWRESDSPHWVLQTKKIVYVSCNPDTFVTDVTELLPFGYTLQTVHVEAVAWLHKI